MAEYRRKNRDVINAKARGYYRDWIVAGKVPPRPRHGPFRTKAQVDHDSYVRNRDKRAATQRAWVQRNRTKVLAIKRRFFQNHKAECTTAVRLYRAQNPDKVREWSRRKYSTVMGRINARMSREIARTLRGGKKLMGWQKAVGYTADDLRRHLESHFTEGMTWEVFMTGAIHIDHRISKTKFKFTSINDIDFKRCWSIYNLQPMWAKDNCSKGPRLLEPTQIPLGI